jgi:hypothetical protein
LKRQQLPGGRDEKVGHVDDRGTGQADDQNAAVACPITGAPEWEQLDVESLCGTILVLGASDTGKSTLARHLCQALCHCGVRAAYVDGDLGRSTLGLPTTMTVVLEEGSGDERFPPQGARTTYLSELRRRGVTCCRCWLAATGSNSERWRYEPGR